MSILPFNDPCAGPGINAGWAYLIGQDGLIQAGDHYQVPLDGDYGTPGNGNYYLTGLSQIAQEINADLGVVYESNSSPPGPGALNVHSSLAIPTVYLAGIVLAHSTSWVPNLNGAYITLFKNPDNVNYEVYLSVMVFNGSDFFTAFDQLLTTSTAPNWSGNVRVKRINASDYEIYLDGSLVYTITGGPVYDSYVPYFNVGAYSEVGNDNLYGTVKNINVTEFVPPPTPPVFIYPTNGSFVLMTSPITFTWSNPGSVRTEYEIAYDSGFTDLFDSNFKNNPETSSDAYDFSGETPGTTYHVRGRNYDGSSYTDWSTPFTFRIVPFPPPTTPVPLTPVNDVDHLVYNVPFPLTFSNPGAVSTEYQVSDNSGFSTIFMSGSAVNPNTSTTNLDFTEAGPYTRFFWRVRGFNGFQYSDWSSPQTFYLGPVLGDLSDAVQPSYCPHSYSFKSWPAFSPSDWLVREFAFVTYPFVEVHGTIADVGFFSTYIWPFGSNGSRMFMDVEAAFGGSIGDMNFGGNSSAGMSGQDSGVQILNFGDGHFIYTSLDHSGTYHYQKLDYTLVPNTTYRIKLLREISAGNITTITIELWDSTNTNLLGSVSDSAVSDYTGISYMGMNVSSIHTKLLNAWVVIPEPGYWSECDTPAPPPPPPPEFPAPKVFHNVLHQFRRDFG